MRIKRKRNFFDITNNQYRSFSRIIPKDDFLEEWLSLSRIGKIAWYWSTINKSIKDDFDKIQNTKKYFVKLSDVDQNFESYLSLVKKFNFKNVLSKGIYNVINEASNKDKDEKYFYKKIFEKNFEKIIDKFFHIIIKLIYIKSILKYLKFFLFDILIILLYKF